MTTWTEPGEGAGAAQGANALLLRRLVVLASRLAYVGSRLLVTLGLPILLGAEALGQFSLFSALITLLPVLFSAGMPEHAARRMGAGANPVIFSAYLMQALASAAGCAALAFAWLWLYPELSLATRLSVAGVAALASLAANAHMLLVGIGVTVRANLALLTANLGPPLAVGFGFLGAPLSIEILCLAWLTLILAGLAIGVPGLAPSIATMRGRGRLFPRPRLQARLLAGLRFLWINQLVDLARTYSDRLVLPLVAGFELAGVYAVFALATSVSVMIPNAVFGQTDLPRLIAAGAQPAGTAALARAGSLRAAALAAVMMLPLFALKGVVEKVLALPLPAGLYYPLCATALLAAAMAAAADYLWYAIYSARAERRLAVSAVATVPFSVLLLTLGAWLGGAIGASAAVAGANAVVLAVRLRVLRAGRAGAAP